MSKIERFLSDPRYQALDDAGKKDKLNLFFNKYVTQDARYAPLDEEGKARVYSKFMSKYYGEPEAKVPKQETPFTDLGSELKGTMSLTQSAVASSTGLVETQTLDRINKAYQKVMADREEALRIIDRESNLKQAIPQDRVAAGQQYIKKVESMQGAHEYPIKSQYTAAMERLQPNSYTDPIERQVAHEIVNKEKLDKAQREYQRIAERTASATPEERKEIAKSLSAQQTLIEYYATGMTAAERAAYQAGQEDSESFRMVKALGAGSIDLASGVYQLFNPDSNFARTINAYSAGLLEQSGNPLEDAFAQVFYSMPMTLGYFMTHGILGAAGTATKGAAIATKAGEVASLMHSVNINAYMTSKKYSEAISGYGSATAVPEGVLLAGSTSALVESAIEMLSDTAQAKIVLGQAKRVGRRGAEQIIKNSLRGKLAGYGIRLATGMAESATTEFLEEILQGASGMIFDVMSNQREVPSLEEAFKELMYSGAVGALGGITFGLGGGIMVQSSNYQNWREVKKQAASGNEHAARLWEARSILDKSNPNGEVWKSDVQRAYDVIKSDLHAVTENRYQEDNPSIAQAMAQMYDAYAMVDMIKSPQQEAVREAMQAGVQRVLDQKKDTAIQEPAQQATESEPQSVENTIVNLVQEGDIEAAESTLNEAIKNGTTGINVPYLRTLVNESKAVAARIAKEEADQKARQDIIDKYGEYADMSHSELQDEAKKRGLKAGGKSTDIMARLKESDEKPKAETTPAKPAAKKPFATNEPTEQQQDRAIKESLIAEETPKKASKYESMGYNALQKEAKKRGINSFGVKKAELIRQLEEKDASTEKAKAERASVYDNSAEIEGIVAGKSADEIKSALGAKLTELKNQGYTSFMFRGKEFSIQGHLDVLARQAKDQAKKDKFLNSKSYKDFIDRTKQQNKAYKDMLAKAERKEPLTMAEAEGFATGVPKGYIKDGDMYTHKDSASAKAESSQDTAPVKAADTEKTKAERASVYDNSAEQKVSPTLSEDVKWKIYKARKEFERYVEGGVFSRISKKEFDNALRKLNALESEYGVPKTRADGTRGGDIYEQKDVTPIEYTGKSDGKIDRNLVDAIKSGEAWMDYNATTSEEWNIAMAEMKEEGTFWGIKDQDIVDQGTKIMEEIDKLLDEIENIDNTTKEYLDDLDESGTYISDEEIKEISDENWEKRKEIEAKIKVLQEKHKDLWDNAKSDQSSQDTAPSKVAEDSKSEAMSRSTFQEQYRQAQEGKLPKGQIDAQLKLYDAMMDTYAKEMGITIDEAYAQTIESVTDQEAGQPTPSEVAKEESGMRTQVDESYAPKKTKIAYKLFRTLKSRPGEIFPLFIGKSEATPIGQWIKAEFIPTKGFQERPGWHLGFAPYAPHLRKADGSMDESRVWYEVEIPDDVDWQTKADATKTGDIRGEVPEGGYYTFKRPGAQGGEWKIAGAIKVIRPLSLEEVNRIKAEKGINDILYQSAQETARYQTIQGYIQKMPNGKYRIGIMQPNVTTGLHEQAHLGKSLMEIMANKSPAWASRLKAAEEWCGVKDGNWTTEAEEKFANGYVKFLADGSAPNGKLKTIFAKIKEWIGSILQGLADVKNLDVSNEMRGVYLSMLGISEGKRNLTSEQKIQSIKLKSAMKQDATSDPLKLETEIDSFADSNDLILEGKRTGNKTSFYLNRIDDGKTMIEIHHSNGEYDVNGYHAANNQEVMEQVTRILGDTRYQITDMPSAAEIAEAERQMAGVRAKYDGTDQWMKAPNGKPTNLNERQWLQVRTQLFKDWFGDWENDPKNASKVVDENGEPLVVYHGTGTYKEFSKTQIFNPEMLGTATNAESAKKGFFFAESKGTAVEYAGLDQIEAPFRSWLDMPSSINEIIGDIRKVILETDAEYVPSTVWEAYGQFVEDIFNSKSNEERLELYLSFKNNESLYYDVMEQEIPQDIIDDAEESLLQDRGFYVERVEGDEDYQEYLEAKEEMQDNAYDLARSIFYEKIGPLSMLFSGADRNKLEPHIRMFDFSKQYDPNDFKIMQVFLSVKNPLDYYFKEGYRDEKFNDLMQKAIADNKDGAIFRNVKDGGGFDNIYVAIGNTQIKSATGNVGTFSESNNIRYQIDNAIQSASPDMQDRIAKIMEKQKKVQQAANATYRELTTKIGRTTSVYEWDSLMRKSLVTAIRNAFPGAAPMNIEKYAALEETLGELDPGLEDHAKEIKRIKAQLRRMVAMDKKFRDALEDVSGFSDIADIPFEGLFSALENTNPAAYDRYFKDETFDILLKALPRIKAAYDGQFTMQTLQRIVDVILNGNDPNVGRDVSELAFLQPQRLFAELFGKAGINTINYAYHGTLTLAAYEMEYTPHLRELNRLLMTADNNRGSAYDGDDLDIIGRTIFEVDGNSKISNKLETIQERLAEWADENNAVINSKDVEEIYNEKEYLKDIMRGFIAEWNANPERTQKIGIREDYDNPRKYNWGDISDITTKGGKYLYTPGNARERSKQDFSEGLDYDANIFNAYSNYMYSMTRYMAFYDLANYVEGSSILYASKGGKAGQKKMASGFDLDLSLAQHKSSAYASKMIEDYVRNTIGYHKKDTPKGRLLASARTNVYASLLAANVIMTVLNYNQRNLVHAVVDQNIAMQARSDVAFWTGLFKPSNEEYPTLSGIMQAYVTADQSLIAELAAEAKRSANQGRTALTRAYYKHSAYNAELLRLSPFSLAELGNRAYAHAAGVYQVTQNSMAYKEYVASGMSRHQAMERALSEDSNLRRAAITYGGIINAEINADANRAFSPHFFGDASKIKKVAIFLRYGVTIALLELRTYGGARDIKSLLSPDLFRLLTSGNVKAATAAQTIQAGAIMKSMLHPKRIAELVRKGQVSTAKTSKNLITVNEVNMVRDAITWALDVQAKHTEGEFHNIIRGKSGAKQAMAALMAFSVSEVLLRSLLELLFSLIPWWKGKKKFIETDVIENIASVLGLFQGLKTASNVRLGSTLAPDLGVYNPTAKTTTKALSQYVLRLTPYAGFANYMGKVFTGKYFSDLFWDEVYD